MYTYAYAPLRHPGSIIFISTMYFLQENTLLLKTNGL